MIQASEKEHGIAPVQYHSLSELTASSLRDSIIYGRIAPGTKITETELAENLQVSRNVIREAVMMLISEGLMVKERNKYTKVVSFTDEDIIDIFDLRIAVEEAAIKRCLLDPTFCDRLSLYAEVIEHNMEDLSKDFAGLMFADMQLHSYIVESSGNRRLQDTWDRIIGPMKMLLYMHMDEGQARKCSHRALIEIIRGGDYAQICTAMEHHIDDSRDRLLCGAARLESSRHPAAG